MAQRGGRIVPIKELVIRSKNVSSIRRPISLGSWYVNQHYAELDKSIGEAPQSIDKHFANQRMILSGEV